MKSRRTILVRTVEGTHGIKIPCLDRILEPSALNERNESLAALFIASWLKLLEDSPLCISGHYKPKRVWRKFCKELFSEPLMDMLKRYSNLADRLLRGLTTTGGGPEHGEWIEEFRDTPVFREYHTFYIQGDPEILRFLLGFLIFGKKLRIEDDAFYTTALKEWLGIEEKLSSLTIPADSTTAHLRRIMSGLLESFKLAPLRPKFGPGKVAERGVLNVDQKFLNLGQHPIVSELLDMSGLDKSEHAEYLRFICLDGSGSSGRVKRSCYHGMFKARLKFVPKDISKARSICMEPDILMYIQQSVLRDFVDCFKEGVVRRYIDLSTQVPNQLAALYGSVTGDVDTIDMSAASDSVSWELITTVFPTGVVKVLQLLRSEYAELPDRSVIRMRKFAPMGSALCFPVQCLTFLAFSVLAGVIHHCRDRGLDLDAFFARLDGQVGFEDFLREVFYDQYGFIHPSIKKKQPPRIFGDDICIDSSTTDTLITMLHAYGFSVNTAKSFVGGQAVRESCGKYYYQGHDITPIRFSLGFRTSLLDAKAVSSQIDLVNRFHEYGYRNLWRFHVRELLYTDDGSRFPICFSERDDLPFRIKSDLPDNRHLQSMGPKEVVRPSKGRFDSGQPRGCHAADYQHVELHCYVDVEKDQTMLLFTELSDSYRYMRWWMERGETSEDAVMTARSRAYAAGDRIRLGWTPA